MSEQTKPKFSCTRDFMDAKFKIIKSAKKLPLDQNKIIYDEVCQVENNNFTALAEIRKKLKKFLSF